MNPRDRPSKRDPQPIRARTGWMTCASMTRFRPSRQAIGEQNDPLWSMMGEDIGIASDPTTAIHLGSPYRAPHSRQAPRPQSP